MKVSKATRKNIVYILILLLCMIGLFQWYAVVTAKRIETQNLNYAMDSAHQTATRVSNQFHSATQRIRIYATLVSAATEGREITPEMLRRCEEVALFDSFRYVDTEGKNLTSDGEEYDISDRDFFQKAMKGESGYTYVEKSRVTGEPVMVFYAPLRDNGEIFGVLLGLYNVDSYVTGMLETTYFGEPAKVFFCRKNDGKIIVSASGKSYENSITDELSARNYIDKETIQKTDEALKGEEPVGFICAKNSETDNLCITPIPDSEFVLVQTFPLSVTRGMIKNANFAGGVVQGILIVLFAVYIVLLFIQTGRRRKILEKENTEMGYVTGGTSTLFNRFVMVDLENDTYKYLLGATPPNKDMTPEGKYEDFIEFLCSGVVNEDDRKGLMHSFSISSIISELADDVQNTQYEYPIRRRGVDGGAGEVEWEHVNIICLERRNGVVTKVLFTRQDITRLKEKEFKVQSKIAVANRKERQYIAATMSDAVYGYEVNLTRDLIMTDIIFRDREMESNLSERVGLKAPYSATEYYERNTPSICDESVEEYKKSANVPALLEVYQSGRREFVFEYWRMNPVNGEKMCIRQSYFMTRDDETGDVMAMVVVKEITEQVKKQREQMEILQHAMMEAQHANNAKTTFLNNMSHDIRTPMNAIIGFTTIAVSQINNKERVLDCLKKVLSSSNHLLGLINDILDMSHIESGKVQIKEQECNISEFTHGIMTIIQPQVKAKQLELFIDTFDVVNEDIIADSLKLSQVLVNLMSNAVKYTPAGGTVSLRIIQETVTNSGFGEYLFIIKDTGIGMSQEFLDRIFEPFERESNVTKTGIQGTGLGMAITKRIVDMMGGEISVKSEKGKGSEFRVKFSLKLQNTVKKEERIKELENLRAMVVDDDPNCCDSVTKMLKKLGMRAEWTTSGKEAVYRARTAHFDGDSYSTYIIDWQMPEMNGIETVRKIRSVIGDEVPIIILTAYDWSDIEEEAREAGVTAFCTKPLFMSDLKNALLQANKLMSDEFENIVPWRKVDFAGKRVLLVEDNEINREIAEVVLTEAGLAVECAPDGTDAVSMVAKSPENYYDVVLMDIQMPVMDGYEATRAIRAMSREDVKKLPIIAMTADVMEENKEMAISCGMNAHIGKPIDTNLLMAVLGKYLYDA